MSDRERFEAWYCADAKAQGVSLPNGIADLRDGNGYGEHRVMLNGKWQGWQASRKQALEAALEAIFPLEGRCEWEDGGEYYGFAINDVKEALQGLANPEGEQG